MKLAGSVPTGTYALLRISPTKGAAVVRVVADRYAEIANTRRVGGQGEVFQVADLHGGPHIALKALPYGTGDVYRLYFERETAALHKLSHPNIASLSDCGVDEKLGVYYLTLPWIPQTLNDWHARHTAEAPGWDDVADMIALPLASALAHAHSLSVLHRDIRPSNVLWTSDDKPLLADFALSKIKSRVAATGDATVLGGATVPWAPPDNASRGSTRFDVYGLAATVLQCVTTQRLRDYPDIARALGAADVPKDVKELLERALHPEARERPADGQVFHLELQAIQDKRKQKWHTRYELSFELTADAQAALQGAGGGLSAEKVLAQRLGPVTHVLPRLETLADGRVVLSTERFRLVGDQVQLMMKFVTDAKLLCVRAEVMDFEDLDRWRSDKNAVPLDRQDFSWSVAPATNPQRAALAAHALNTLIKKAVQDAEDRTSEWFKQTRIRDWSILIDAKEQLEERLEGSIAFSRISSTGTEFTLRATSTIPDGVLDQERLVRPTGAADVKGVNKNRKPILVTIVDVNDKDLTVRTTAGVDLPATGVLVVDRSASRVVLRRQKEALADLREGSAARPQLRELVLEPALALPPVPVAFEPVTPDLDHDKQIAVSNALGAGDVFLVEGPPGTGKTSFICELINQYLRARPHDKVLLVSQMHVAIDNAVTRLHDSGVQSVVRLSSREDRVDPDAAHLLLTNKLNDWVTAIGARARDGMTTLAGRRGVPAARLRLALNAEEALACMRRKAVCTQNVEDSAADQDGDEDDLSVEHAGLVADYELAAQQADVVLATVSAGAVELGIELPATPDETRLTTLVTDLLSSSTDPALRELISAQGDWLGSLRSPAAAEPIFLPTQSVVAGTCLGFLSNPHIQDMQFDLCIVDEASRATAPELLVPMTRAKRWVLVGDPKQLPPMREDVLKHPDLVETFDLDKKFVSMSLFDVLLAETPEPCCTRLVTQHRMATPIGDLISHCFYDGELVSEPFASLEPATVPEDDRLVWYSTSGHEDRNEEAQRGRKRSVSNKFEAEHIAKLVGRLNTDVAAGRYRRRKGGPLEVLILSGYTNQCSEIERALRPLTLADIDVQVKTIDAVQGREADVVIFSVTRSNLHGDLGFLDHRVEGRTNVALSRAREILWIVGDSDFAASLDGPLKKVVHHITSRDAGRIEQL
ncbi:serine/threonine-protein kinase [[Mycobacterium] fortunisiensis]|nr:serine/threonine-protein kinase [[Mycobacterium] fortunisiensis]